MKYKITSFKYNNIKLAACRLFIEHYVNNVQINFEPIIVNNNSEIYLIGKNFSNKVKNYLKKRIILNIDKVIITNTSTTIDFVFLTRVSKKKLSGTEIFIRNMFIYDGEFIDVKNDEK